MTLLEGFILQILSSPDRQGPKPETAWIGDIWKDEEGLWVFHKNIGWHLEIPSSEFNLET